MINFPRWQNDLPELTDLEQLLDRVVDGFINLLNYPPCWRRGQDVCAGPDLFLGGFYLPPFHVKSEQSVEITN